MSKRKVDIFRETNKVLHSRECLRRNMDRQTYIGTDRSKGGLIDYVVPR